MKVSEQWLGEWVETELRGEALAERLTLNGLEVDGLERIEPLAETFVVGHVVSVEQHPNADRLTVCQVDVGSSEALNIVCGAPNARTGMYSIVATVGSKLPGGLAIRRSKLRGVVSEGMLCSVAELGLGDDHDGIIDLPHRAPPGASAASVLGLPDSIIDIDITPNRGDCFSVLGIAREVAAATTATLRLPDGFGAGFEPSGVRGHEVEVAEPADCPSFASAVVTGIDPEARSPLWLTERLRRAGLRPIHPVVDVTNYVMLELGQPLHGYDLDRLSGPIRVRRGVRGESLTLLDEREVDVDDSVLVIADDSGAIGLAGIMGGLSTAVSGESTNVLFEGAFFSRAVVAGRARRFGLHTDASLRFERGVDPAGQVRAIERAVKLLVGIAGGESGPVSHVVSQEHLPAREPVSLRWSHLDSRLGLSIDRERVVAILSGLGMAVESARDGLEATPPSHRFDVEIADDLVEEVARIHGYDAIPIITAAAQAPLPAQPEGTRSDDRLRDVLVERGYREIISYSFVDPVWQDAIVGSADTLELSNPISTELSVMRRSLLPGLLRTLVDNRARQQERLRLFEIGHCFDPSHEFARIGGVAAGAVWPEHWDQPRRAIDFFDIKSDLERLAGSAEADLEFEPLTSHPALHPGRAASIRLGGTALGVLGALHPGVAQDLEIDAEPVLFELDVDVLRAVAVPRHTPVSRYPSVRRDIALLVDEDVSAGAIVRTVTEATPAFVRDVHVFDIYRGKGVEAGLKSVALGLILQETSRTLTDEDSDGAVHAAVVALTDELGARLRDQ